MQEEHAIAKSDDLPCRTNLDAPVDTPTGHATGSRAPKISNYNFCLQHIAPRHQQIVCFQIAVLYSSCMQVSDCSYDGKEKFKSPIQPQALAVT
jgi:hypothetical protein